MLLMTGATGALGVEILRIQLRERGKQPARFLIRARDDHKLSERWRKILAIASDGQAVPDDLPELRPIAGDITSPDLGLRREQLDELKTDVTEVIHSAATVDFDEPLESCRHINVDGARNIFDLATEFRSLIKFGHVSTLYVAGKRTGEIRERDLHHNHGFVTMGYEQSKYESEILAWQYADRLPMSVYRMSLLMGCSRDGYVHDHGAVQRYLKFMFKGIAPCFPGLPDCPLDFLPHDYSAEVLSKLFHNHFKAGATYQISASTKAPTAMDWLQLTANTYADHSPQWARGSYNIPDIVSWKTYQLYKKTLYTIENLELMKVIHTMDSCFEELFCPKTFRRDLVDRTLDVNDESIPDYREYYPRILQQCIETRWGLSPRFERA